MMTWGLFTVFAVSQASVQNEGLRLRIPFLLFSSGMRTLEPRNPKLQQRTRGGNRLLAAATWKLDSEETSSLPPRRG